MIINAERWRRRRKPEFAAVSTQDTAATTFINGNFLSVCSTSQKDKKRIQVKYKKNMVLLKRWRVERGGYINTEKTRKKTAVIDCLFSCFFPLLERDRKKEAPLEAFHFFSFSLFFSSRLLLRAEFHHNLTNCNTHSPFIFFSYFYLSLVCRLVSIPLPLKTSITGARAFEHDERERLFFFPLCTCCCCLLSSFLYPPKAPRPFLALWSLFFLRFSLNFSLFIFFKEYFFHFLFFLLSSPRNRRWRRTSPFKKTIVCNTRASLNVCAVRSEIK